jgi:hypothetical protein
VPVTTFQLDECFDNKDLAEACNAEQKCVVDRCPAKGVPDEGVLADVFARQVTLLTIDRTIVDDHPTSIVSPNSGIVVIRNKRPLPFMTIPRAKRIIATCKRNIPSWPLIDWSMIYVEIDEEEIYLCPLIDADITKGQPFLISNNTLDAAVTQYIEEIHQNLKNQLPPRSPASGQN